MEKSKYDSGWVDDTKPNMNQFLKPIVDDLCDLQLKGVDVMIGEASVTTKAVLLSCVCDLPAKTAILNMKGHGGTSKDGSGAGCPYCKHPGHRLVCRLYSQYD